MPNSGTVDRKVTIGSRNAARVWGLITDRTTRRLVATIKAANPLKLAIIRFQKEKKVPESREILQRIQAQIGVTLYPSFPITPAGEDLSGERGRAPLSEADRLEIIGAAFRDRIPAPEEIVDRLDGIKEAFGPATAFLYGVLALNGEQPTRRLGVILDQYCLAGKEGTFFHYGTRLPAVLRKLEYGRISSFARTCRLMMDPGAQRVLCPVWHAEVLFAYLILKAGNEKKVSFQRERGTRILVTTIGRTQKQWRYHAFEEKEGRLAHRVKRRKWHREIRSLVMVSGTPAENALLAEIAFQRGLEIKGATEKRERSLQFAASLNSWCAEYHVQLGAHFEERAKERARKKGRGRPSACYEQALIVYSNGLVLRPYNLELLFAKARMLIKLGRYDEAVEFVDGIAEGTEGATAPDQRRARVGAAVYYCFINQPEKAKGVYSSLTEKGKEAVCIELRRAYRERAQGMIDGLNGIETPRPQLRLVKSPPTD